MIQQIFPAQSVFWRLNGISTGLIADNATAGLQDTSGQGNHGTADNADGSLMAWTTGQFGGAVDFDGSDDSIDWAILPRCS